jgi:hypothetical protein
MKTMKKYINFRILLFAVLMMILSCDSNTTEDEPIVGTDDYPLATFVVQGESVDETGGGVVTVDITFDKPIDRGVTFSGTQVGGDAVENEDYIINSVIVEAYSTSAQMTIVIYEDEIPEGDETLSIQVDRPSLANKYLINPDSDLPLINITISNYESDVLDLSFDWETGIPYAGDTYGACANIDLDIFISEAAGFDITDPWASTLFGVAATGDCPEEASMTFEDYPDGTYVAWSELWENGFYGLDTNTDVPITTRATRAGVFSSVIDQDESQWMNSDDAGVVEGADTWGIILYIKVEAGIWTVIDYDGETQGSGKTANLGKARTPRPIHLNKTSEKTKGLVK